MTTRKATAMAVFLAAVGVALPWARAAVAQPAAGPETELAEGTQLFRQACAGCHKWHGGGGGGYGGAALSLRATHLSRDRMIETVECGRPGTGMPYFLRDAYAANKCYGLTRAQLGKMMPIEAPIFLRPNEVADVIDYVTAKVKGRGDPSYAECLDFFGTGSRVCNTYKVAPKTAAH